MKNKSFTMAMLFYLASTGLAVMPVNAEEAPEHNLDEVIVEADREKVVQPGGFIYNDAKNGILGSTNIMNIPFSQIGYTKKTIETFGDPSQPLNTILVNNPSIRTSSSSPRYTDFSMRGINMNGNHMYLNGIPNLFAQFLSPPVHVIESIEVMSGPNTVLNGSTTSVNGVNGVDAPAGIISITTKKATDKPINQYTQTFSGRGSLGEYIDVGSRFGKDKEWGLRVNGGNLDGDLSVPGAEKEERTLFINLDHRDEKSKTNLFAGYFDLRVNGAQRWFGVNNASTSLVDAPDSQKSYDFDGMTKYMHGYLMTLNHEQKINENWNLFFNAGMTSRSGSKYDTDSGSLSLNGNTGAISGSLIQMKEANKNVYFQMGVKGEVYTGAVKNNLSLAIDRSWVKDYRTSASNGSTLGGSLLNGVFMQGSLPQSGSAALLDEETSVGITLADTMEYGKISTLVAVQRRDSRFDAYGTKAESNNNLSTSPTYAISYKPVENVAFYASHSEGYTRARVATSTYANAGELFKPVKNKQNEFGVKYQHTGVFTTLSFFELNQENYFDITPATGKKTLSRDGQNAYKGIELNVNGKLADKWNAMGGIMYLDAQRIKTAKGLLDGYHVNGVAEWSGVLALEYEADKKTSIIGRAVYSGSAYVTDNKAQVPSVVTFDLGIKHKTAFSGTPVTLSAMCYNVADKDYWIARGGSSTIGLSMPRTLMLSATIDI